MDNGLIFPYRRQIAPGEVSDAKCPKLPGRPFGAAGVVERMTRAGSSQAMV